MQGDTLKQSHLLKKVPMLIICPQFRTIVSLSEFVICLVSAKLWNFLEARMLCDKCHSRLCVCADLFSTRSAFNSAASSIGKTPSS